MLISFICLSYNQVDIIFNLLNTIERLCVKYEIILIDDGSDDDTIYNVIKKNIKNIRIIQLKYNTKNQSLCRNLGIKISSGTHTYFIDGDDILLSNNFNNLIDYIKDKNVDIYFVPIQHLKVDGSYYVTKIILRDDLELSHAPCQYILSKNFIVKNNVFFDEIKYTFDNEDCFIFYLALSKAKKILYLNNFSEITCMIHSIGNNTYTKFNKDSYPKYLFELCNCIKNILIKNGKKDLITFINNYYYNEMIRIKRYKINNVLPI